MDTITEEHGVMLKKGKNLKYIFFKKGKLIYMENFNFYCDAMIGKPFGSAFKVAGKQLQMIDPILVEEHASEYINDIDGQAEDSRDNRNINDDNEKSQSLSKEEIMSYRAAGTSGEEIIEKIIENSSTFNDRTEFSKEKYKKKKNKKYLAHFVALRPSLRLLARMYFNKKSEKILHMRPDMLAHILTLANVNVASNALLVDTTGLLVAALVERIVAPSGSITRITASYMNRDSTGTLAQLGISPGYTRCLLGSLPITRLDDLPALMQSKSDEEIVLELMPAVSATEACKAGQKRSQPFPSDTESKKAKMENWKLEDGNWRLESESLQPDESESTPESISDTNKQNFRDIKIEETLLALKNMRAGNFSSLILASKFHPKKLLLSLYPYLGLSQPFVVYCAQREPLMDCYMELMKLGACCMELADHWYREQQVVPSRTHPDIMMPAANGFLLRGVKVAPT